nr:uncharacterized protein LOC113803046 [Penaeus vannamei]
MISVNFRSTGALSLSGHPQLRGPPPRAPRRPGGPQVRVRPPRRAPILCQVVQRGQGVLPLRAQREADEAVLQRHGIEVDHEASTGQQVVLKDVTLATSGRYKCEVLAEAPAFNTLVEYAILTVVAIPKEKPIVQGAQERYRPGDYVRVNCTSAPSKPAATLTWFINDNIVPSEYLVRYPPIMLPDGLEQSTQGLHFKATHEHFPHNIMSLRCAASIGFFYNKTEETSLETHRPALSLESRKHFYGSRSAPLPCGSLGLTLVLLACALGALR